jgi:hypothetical protein
MSGQFITIHLGIFSSANAVHNKFVCGSWKPQLLLYLSSRALDVDGSCPGNFFCWFSMMTNFVNAFYCCRSPDSIDTECNSFESPLLSFIFPNSFS